MKMFFMIGVIGTQHYARRICDHRRTCPTVRQNLYKKRAIQLENIILAHGQFNNRKTNIRKPFNQSGINFSRLFDESKYNAVFVSSQRPLVLW